MNDREPRHVNHAELPLFSDSYWKRQCPCCDDGVMLVMRGEDYQLLAEDHCVGCGQRFVYDDIDAMRRIDNGELG